MVSPSPTAASTGTTACRCSKGWPPRSVSAACAKTPETKQSHQGASVPDNAANDIKALEEELRRATERGQHETAAKLWERLLERHPDHVAALTAVGQRAFARGDLARARQLLQRLVAVDGR